MELHAEDRKLFVPGSHDNPLELGGLLKAIRQLQRTQAVITTGLQRILDAGKHVPSVVRDPRGLAVHWLGRVADLPAEILHDDLMSQADTQDGQLVFEMVDHRERHARRVRRARPR